MATMQRLVKVPEIQSSMRELSKEMTRAGIMEEMMEDTFDDLDQEDMEEDIQKEVDAVVNELIGGIIIVKYFLVYNLIKPILRLEPLKRAPTAVTDSLPVREEEEEAEDMSEMQARLQALRS